MTTLVCRSGVVVLIGLVLFALVSPADGRDVDGGRTGFVAHLTDYLPPGGGGAVPTSSNGPHVVGVFQQTECMLGLGGAQTCSGDLAVCDDGTTMVYTSYEMSDGSIVQGGNNCPEDAVVSPPQVTPGMVLRAFRRIPLPASEVVVQPPGGRTLVNFDTNFYTEQGEFTRVVRLLGQRVELRIWPDTFTWRYGDGASEQTSSAGSAYPDLEITHRYLSKGRVAVSVDTTYAADFRVGNGGWQHVDGTVTIPGEAESLRVVTARPVLVGG